jgi:hypothetical protein
MAVTLRQLAASTSSILIWGSAWGFPSIIEISVRKFKIRLISEFLVNSVYLHLRSQNNSTSCQSSTYASHNNSFGAQIVPTVCTHIVRPPRQTSESAPGVGPLPAKNPGSAPASTQFDISFPAPELRDLKESDAYWSADNFMLADQTALPLYQTKDSSVERVPGPNGPNRAYHIKPDNKGWLLLGKAIM